MSSRDIKLSIWFILILFSVLTTNKVFSIRIELIYCPCHDDFTCVQEKDTHSKSPMNGGDTFSQAKNVGFDFRTLDPRPDIIRH